ncbi:monocarboxylate transporter 4 [Fusarium albosuccineum]|uniref:Monocarboxylate transporter 4 n=1 Tax=Fusarium albosuccineum TaxID=1237068 RepID=A0A8H4P229_9HYPO|nr:monocarboxylate transporter 4 [Fusarium albosuccineum]
MIPILDSPDIGARTDFIEPTHGAPMSSHPSTTARHPSAQQPSPSNGQNPAVAVSHGNCDLPPKIGARFTFQTVKILRDWLSSSSQAPYPSDEDKMMLQDRTGLNQTQISNWLTNARRRNKIRTAKSARPQSDGSRALPIDIPRPSTPYVSGGRTSHLNPLQRWVDSPPEDEAASITAIARALSLPTNPAQHGYLPSDKTSGQSSVSSAGVSSNDSSAQASSQISRSTASSLLMTSRSRRRRKKNSYHGPSHVPPPLKTFQKDHLVQHLRLVHNAEYLGWTMSRWKSECNGVVSRCGLCGIAMDSWHARQDHLAEHFRMGDTMADWKDLINEERNSPFPFSATVPPVESPSSAHELIKLEVSCFIISHQEKVGCHPTDVQLQLEACRVIFASEALSKKVEALPPSWLRDLIMASEAITQQARFGPLRSLAESRLAILKVNRQDHLFQHCPMEQLLQGYARAAGSGVSDKDLQNQACHIILDAEEDSTTPSDVFVDWLLRQARSSPAWLLSFRRRTFGLDNRDTTSNTVKESPSDAVESPTHVDASDADFISAGANSGVAGIQGIHDSSLSPHVHVQGDPVEQREASLSESYSSLQCQISSLKPWLYLAGHGSDVNKDFSTQPTDLRDRSPAYSSTSQTTMTKVVGTKYPALFFSNDANSYHRLAQDLARFVKSTTSPNNPAQHVPTDEELQHQARCILYYDDDPWNQTAADNPEWLLQFKLDVGLIQPRL